MVYFNQFSLFGVCGATAGCTYALVTGLCKLYFLLNEVMSC